MNLSVLLFLVLGICCIVSTQEVPFPQVQLQQQSYLPPQQQQLIPQRKCAKIGEYCQNHWECCSNSCLSYSYKCIKSYQPSQQDIQQTSTESLEDVSNNVENNTNAIKKIVNRFNENSSSEENSIKQCLPVGQKCYHSSECCTQRCPSYLLKCVS